MAQQSRRVSRRNSTPLARFGSAIAHPLRIEILNFLSREGTGSATIMSRAFGERLANVDYHMKVLRETCDVLELVEERRVRGAHEHLYRVKQETVVELLAWPKIPPPVREGLQGAGLVRFIETALDAIEDGSLDAHEDTVFNCWTVTLDEDGWDEANEALTEAAKRIAMAGRQSAKRGKRPGSADLMQTVVGAVQFEVPVPEPPDESQEAAA